MIRTLHVRSIGGIVAAFAAVLLLSGHAHAATTVPDNDQGVQISPTLISLATDPLKPVTATVTVMNVTNKTLTFKGNIEDFSAKDETGTPLINLDSSLPSTISMKSWTSAVTPFTLKPYDSKQVTVTITPPSIAEAGGHYGVLRFSGTDATAAGNGVAVTVSAGTLLLMRVSGNINEHLSVATFSTTNDNYDHQGLFETAPVHFLTRLTNDGTIHLQPTGSIDITDMFGRPVTSIAVNSDKGYILPNSTRRFESTFNKGWLFGRYTANLSMGYGTTGEALENTITFWVIPYKLIALIIVIILVLIFGIRFAFKRTIRRAVEKATKKSDDK